MTVSKKLLDKQERELLPDLLKGLAVILVVLGHCIQETNGQEFSSMQLYFSNKLYQFIYSFHMPLFMLITGYFSYSSLARANDMKMRFKVLGTRLLSCLFPVFAWTVLDIIRGYIVYHSYGEVYISLDKLPAMFWNLFYNNLWFLWAVAICYLITFIVHSFLKDNFMAYLILFIIMFVLPDTNNMNVYEYMLPFFVTGFYLRKLKAKENGSQNFLGVMLTKAYKFVCGLSDRIMLLISALFFIGLFILYNDKVFIYVSGYRIFNANPVKMIVVDMYRMVIGFAGCLFFYYLFKNLTQVLKDYSWPVLRILSRYSMGMYIIQAYYIILVIKNYTIGFSYSLIRTIVLATVVTVITLITSVIIGLIPGVRAIIGVKAR